MDVTDEFEDFLKTLEVKIRVESSFIGHIGRKFQEI